MTDNPPIPNIAVDQCSLRDRIAAAIERGIPDVGASDFGVVADAVIAELGLKRMEMGEWDVLAQGFRGFRYVTPWDVDDE